MQIYWLNLAQFTEEIWGMELHSNSLFNNNNVDKNELLV
jgi:hypothetical protein